MTGEICEAPFLYILVAACLFSNYPRKRACNRERFTTRFPHLNFAADANHVGVRTPTRQFSSAC